MKFYGSRLIFVITVMLVVLVGGLAATVAQDEAAAGELIAPPGVYGETYFAPFPLAIVLDGEFEDWAGVPRVTMPAGRPAVSFAAAADEEFLYLTADVIDDNIISGTHGENYWNEDSIEFYINGTGDLSLRSYVDGVVQITIPALNADLPPEEAIIAGVRGPTAGAKVVTVRTETGYAVEVAVPLKNDIWEIVPEADSSIGFQVHLNGAAVADRNMKLIWSVFDTGDQSYLNPSLFGQLIFFEISDERFADPSVIEDVEAVVVDESITWDSREWELVWSDEFEGAAGTPINSEYWTAEIGGHGWGNNELEYYTNRVENASLDGEGSLAIVARQENPGDYSCHYGRCEYTSARLITKGKVEFTYGRVEARIRIPRGQGIWPAFWMLGANFPNVGWPNSGEIDILENVGFAPRTVHGTIHGPGYSGANGIGGSISSDSDYADDFHVYAIDWDADAIRWYVDGELYNIITPNDLGGRRWVFDHDFFMILNVAVGGNWPGRPDETTEFPQTMLVDYVRVYRLAGQAE